MQFGNVAERAAVKAALLKVSVFITDWRKGGAGDKTEATVTDRHMQKVKHELSRGQSSWENVLHPPQMPDGTEDILRTAALVWCLGYLFSA